jgi:hypothetical protein
MATQKLVKRVIDGTTATDSDCIVWDSDLAGFGIRGQADRRPSLPNIARAGGALDKRAATLSAATV